MFGGGELEVAINVTGFAEADVKDLLFLVVRGSGEHPLLRIAHAHLKAYEARRAREETATK